MPTPPRVRVRRRARSTKQLAPWIGFLRFIHSISGLEILITKRKKKKLGLGFLPLVYTVDGFCSRETVSNLLYLFGIDISDEIKGPGLCRHLFMMAGRCPKGLGMEQYQRIALLKGFLRCLSGTCAKTAAWALRSHMVPGKSPLPAGVGAEWDHRTGVKEVAFAERSVVGVLGG